MKSGRAEAISFCKQVIYPVLFNNLLLNRLFWMVTMDSIVSSILPDIRTPTPKGGEMYFE